MRRGEVWWGGAGLAGGSRKRRPFLVVSNDAFNSNERYPKVMVVHLTSVQRLGQGFPWEVTLPRGAAGLSVSSVVKCGEVYTLLKSQLDGLCGALGADQLRLVDQALMVAFGLRRA